MFQCLQRLQFLVYAPFHSTIRALSSLPSSARIDGLWGHSTYYACSFYFWFIVSLNITCHVSLEVFNRFALEIHALNAAIGLQHKWCHGAGMAPCRSLIICSFLSVFPISRSFIYSCPVSPTVQYAHFATFRKGAPSLPCTYCDFHNITTHSL